MLLATALAITFTGCAQQTFTVQNKPAAVAPKETITHVSSFLERSGKRRAAKFVAAQKMLLKQKPTNIRKWIARFFCAEHLYSAGHIVCAHNNCMSCHRYGQLYLHCSLIYFWVPSSCLHSDQPLSEGEIIPFAGVCPVRGRLHYPRRRRWWLHALTDRLLWCATDDQRQHHHAEHHFQLLLPANSFVYFASSAATSRWRICANKRSAAFASSSRHFLSRWAL